MDEISAGVRGILFDLDGTLLDTIDDISDAANTVLRRHGFPLFTSEDYRRMVGWGITELMRRCIPGERVDRQLLDSCVAEMKAEYAAHPVDRTRPYEGVIAVVRELGRRGYKLAVLSNKAHELTTIIVEKIFPADSFAVVQGQRSSIPPKPDPEAALSICATFGLKPSEMLYVGDTAVDMETALNAGMTPLGVSWGFRDRTEVVNAGARMVIDTPYELLEILAGVPGTAV
ncbi:MAG TPA: HAD family hydrolase [Spirochaetia bacterium]|nr:HAD family hydrolase [Spirochaetia bacterium]